jgi:hypothetical protein
MTRDSESIHVLCLLQLPALALFALSAWVLEPGRRYAHAYRARI